MRKLLNTLYITSENTYVHLEGENIVCKSEEKKFRVPFSNIEEIISFSYNGLTPALMGKCGEYGIPISFISTNGKFLARVIGKSKGNVILRKKQVHVLEAENISMIKNLVSSKIYNTIHLINRSLRDHPEINAEGNVSKVIEQLKDIIEKIYNSSDVKSILGFEGVAAKLYFGIFDCMVLHNKKEFNLGSRTKRPPLDSLNAILSFLYSLWTSNYASALESVGLDSYIGFYHELRSGRTSLACDLVEETRHIVERFTLTIINLRQINTSDFDKQVSGAVYLNDAGRKKVLKLWQEKKRSIILHPYIKEKIHLGLLPFVQANLFAKFIRDELKEYPNYLAR